jgi:alpha-amylase
MVYAMGYKGMLAEGAKHVLGWKSPNYLYHSINNPSLKLLLKNSKFSDDISFRFSNYDWNEYPLTADKFIHWIASTPESEQLINLFMNYETFGNLQLAESGIFEFLKAIPRFAAEKKISFSLPADVINKLKSVDAVSVPYPSSWADEERDTSAWLGNILQKEAFEKLYSIGERVRMGNDRRIKQDWTYLQTSDHFYYMSTKHFSDGAIHSYFSPYDTPYDAFSNYMNVLSDFIDRVNAQYPANIDNEELNSLLTTIANQGKEIESLQSELKKQRQRITARTVKTTKIGAN